MYSKQGTCNSELVGSSGPGKKFDSGKNKIGMVLSYFSLSIPSVGLVGTFGNKKYGNGFHDSNWDKVENGKERYLDALIRHLFSYMSGTKIDLESGRPHLAHAAWNVLALLEMDLRLEQPIEKV